MDEQRPDLETVYREFHPRVVRYLNRLIGPEDAEDIAQDVFAKIARALPELRSGSQLSTWVYRIATNTALDRVRSADYCAGIRSVPIGDYSDEEPAGCEIVSPGSSAEQQTIRDEMSTCVQDLVRKLPEDYQVVLALSETQELKDREIADVLGVSLQTVKIRLHRARARLRESLESRCGFYHNSENTLLCDIKRAPPKS